MALSRAGQSQNHQMVCLISHMLAAGRRGPPLLPPPVPAGGCHCPGLVPEHPWHSASLGLRVGTHGPPQLRLWSMSRSYTQSLHRGGHLCHADTATLWSAKKGFVDHCFFHLSFLDLKKMGDQTPPLLNHRIIPVHLLWSLSPPVSCSLAGSSTSPAVSLGPSTSSLGSSETRKSEKCDTDMEGRTEEQAAAKE